MAAAYWVAKPEAKVERFLCEGVVLRGGWPAKMTDAGSRGAPDRECRFPDALLIYVETKSLNGKLETWQIRYHERLRDLGYIVLTLWTIGHVEKFFSDYDRGVYG